jgi:hypothetical protein
MKELRSICDSLTKARESLGRLGAQDNGEYEFTDYVYDIGKLRVRHRSNRGAPNAQLLFASDERVFADEASARIYLQATYPTAVYKGTIHRSGSEYVLGVVKVFLERIDGVPDTIEVEAPTEGEAQSVLELLGASTVIHERTAAWVLTQQAKK